MTEADPTPGSELVPLGGQIVPSPGAPLEGDVLDGGVLARPPQGASYSTGLLDNRQHATITKWADRLRLDKPLPGTKKKDRGGLQLFEPGIDDRPAASLSAVIAAVIADLLAHDPPTPLEIALYALEVKESRQFPESRPRHRARGFYLPADLAAQQNTLQAEASTTINSILSDLYRKARAIHPGRERADIRDQHDWVAEQLHTRGLPLGLMTVQGVSTIPAGTLAKMAINRLHRRAVNAVIQLGVTFAAEHLDQPHRLRKDLADDH